MEKLSLVIGCGYSSQRNLCKSKEIVAIDIDKQKIMHAKKTDRRAHYLVADARFLPLRSGVINDIVCSEVLEHILNYKSVLFNIVTLQPKTVYLTFPTQLKERILTETSKVYREQHWGKVHVTIVQPHEVAGLLKNCEYEVRIDMRPASMTITRAIMALLLEKTKFDYEIPEIGLVSFQRKNLFPSVVVLVSTILGLILGRALYLPWKLFRMRTLHDSYIIEGRRKT